MKFKKHLLKNGIRVITAPSREKQAVTILLLFKIGSRYEAKNLSGISHFIEHMMYKGTRKRPNTLAIAKELDGVGATYNAFTAKDHTGYYVKINHEKIKVALDILADIVLNSKFAKEEIVREKKVILEEIKMYEDNPMIFIEEFLESVLYEGQPLGQLISGTPKTVSRLTREQLLNFKKKLYNSRNLVITVAGRFEEKKMLELLKRYFHGLPSAKRIVKFNPAKLKSKGPNFNIKFKKTEQIQLALGFPGYSYFHRDLYALYLLAVILGGNMSSRLFISIRERLGLAYFVKADVNVYQDIGNLEIEAGLDQRNIKKALVVISEELRKIRTEGVAEEELKRAKEFMKGKWYLNLEDSENIASWLGKQELLTGVIDSPEDKIKKINRVKIPDLKRVAKDIFQKEKLALALIGPFTSQKQIHPFIQNISF